MALTLFSSLLSNQNAWSEERITVAGSVCTSFNNYGKVLEAVFSSDKISQCPTRLTIRLEDSMFPVWHYVLQNPNYLTGFDKEARCSYKNLDTDNMRDRGYECSKPASK
jgi:hypothetical protein